MAFMKPVRAIAFLQVLTVAALTTVQASSLEGSELEAYNGYCPAGNYRAVWAEPLAGLLAGWVNLVCLDEDVQETSYWYVTPEGEVISHDEAQLPVYVRPMAEEDVVASINALADDENIMLWLDFKYDEPDVPSLEAFGAPEGIVGVSGSTGGGPDGEVVYTYELNGQAVTEAEYQQWETSYNAAIHAQEAERDRLIVEQVHLALYDLVDLNQWHDFVNVIEINNDNSLDPRWEFDTSIVITLSGKQARAMLQSSEALVYVSLFEEPVSVDGGPTELPIESQGSEAQDQPTSESNSDENSVMEVETMLANERASSVYFRDSGSGFLHPFMLLILCLYGCRFANTLSLNNFHGSA